MKLPEVTQKSEDEIAEIIRAIQNSELSDSIKSFVIKCIELAIWVPAVIQRKNISIARLRTLIFGKGNKKIRTNNDPEVPEVPEAPEAPEVPEVPEVPGTLINNVGPDESNNTTAPVEHEKQKGHGRMPHTVYKNCIEVTIDTKHQIGDFCPTLCGGKLGSYSPGILIRIKGQNFANITRYSITKLRCNLCGIIIQPELPKDIGKEKYDVSFKAMLALQKYYVAVPFYRQECFQAALGFPLPDSTQWDLIEQLAGSCYAIFNELKFLAANGKLIHNDDTKVRILEVMKRLNDDNENSGGRKGMFTTGIISIYQGYHVALFLNGTKHAGENIEDVLKKRTKDKKPIIQMCDGSSQNIPKGISTIICNCLSHGFRKFEELVDYFPEECITIMKSLGKVYDNDEKTRNMTDAQRLDYHQTHSKPIMDSLKQYMDTLLAERRIEPNSELGEAIRYMQKRWPKLTRFLSVAGAPLDNNIVERALKIAIRNRKAAMFYKTEYSAYIGGMITSLIYTCVLAQANPHDYLTVLQQHQQQVNKSPSCWLPWNYQETLQTIQTIQTIQHHPPLIMEGDANHQAKIPPGAHLAAA